MSNFDYKNLTPFKWFVLENFPFIEADFDALSEWQLFCKLGNELNKVINSTNTLGTQVEDLTNYFDNLDVQDEIDNKLNDMAESGQLEEIIAQYLQLAGLLCFNTVNDMKNATNLINGSFVKTFGLNQYNDGKGEFYKIRNILNTDMIDNINIIALNNFNTLIAEKMQNYYLNILQNDVNLIKNKKYIFVGDSYLEGYTPNGTIESWGLKTANILGLTSEQYRIVAYGGSGFVRTDTKTFSQMINELENDNYVSDIIVCGGYNDQGASYENLLSYMTDFKNKCNIKFPNAKISIGHIGWTKNSSTIYPLHVNIINYKKCAEVLGLKYLSNVEYSLKDYFSVFSSDGFHPNNVGQEYLANSISSAILTGCANIQLPFKNITYTYDGTITANGNLATTVINGMTSFFCESIINLSPTNPMTLVCDGRLHEIGTITNGYSVGTTNGTVSIPCIAVIGITNAYATLFGSLVINNGKIYVRFYSTDNITQGSDFATYNDVYLIQLMCSNTSVDSTLS